MLSLKALFSSKRLTSSQMIDRCYKEAGIQLFDEKKGDYVKPGEIADLLVKWR